MSRRPLHTVDSPGITRSIGLDVGSRRTILNLMVQYQMLDRTFAALADPTRRDILDRLGRGPASISELAGPAGMSLTGMKKHVKILEGARLVTTEKVGRTRRCRLGPERLEDAAQWIQLYRRQWERRFDGLESYLGRRRGGRR
jgi:DNA-binding transcriptional ArsR family regulator